MWQITINIISLWLCWIKMSRWMRPHLISLSGSEAGMHHDDVLLRGHLFSHHCTSNVILLLYRHVHILLSIAWWLILHQQNVSTPNKMFYSLWKKIPFSTGTDKLYTSNKNMQFTQSSDYNANRLEKLNILKHVSNITILKFSCSCFRLCYNSG